MTDTPQDPHVTPEPEKVDGVSGEQPPAQWAAPGQNDPTQAYPTEQLPPQQDAAAPSPDNAASAEQPAPPQPPYEQPAYGQIAYGYPATPGQNPYDGHQPQNGTPNPYVTAYPAAPAPGYGPGAQPGGPSGPNGPGFGQRPAPKPKQPGKRGAGFVVAVFAIGALVGGAAGAGVFGIVNITQSVSAQPTANTGAGNITVNDAKEATPVTAVAAKASPSVVTISVQSGQEAGTGSGIILSKDGYILTNTHVVTLDGDISSPQVQVQTNDGRLYSASVVATDPIVDLAVIKLKDASGLTPATFADSSKLNVGDQAVAIGAPLGLSGTVTDGIVSALNRSIQIQSSAAPKEDQQSQGQQDEQNPFNLWNFDLPGQPQQQSQSEGTISLPVIQTDAAINPGNSGGALLNSQGEVIGINVAIASASQTSSQDGQTGSIGVGFAIPSNLGKRIADELIKDHQGSHGLLGATVRPADASTTNNTVGAEIVSTQKGGAAAKAGLKAGDVVTNFNGIPITNATDLTAQVRYLAAGSDAKLTYVRDGKAYTTQVKLGELTQ